MIDRSSSLLSTFETILKMVAHFRAVARLNSYRNGGSTLIGLAAQPEAEHSQDIVRSKNNTVQREL